MNQIRSALKLLTALLIVSGFAEGKTNSWLVAESSFALSRLLRNISASDTKPGVVVAAQTRRDPNYYYHWVRDAGITMDAVVLRYRQSKDNNEKALLKTRLFEYLNFSGEIQNVRTLTGLGEPKFNVDGSAYNEPWGRPQNDSPALRAISLINFAEVLIAEGDTSYISKLYSAKLPADSVIKKDLEFISHQWRAPSFDLWEEVQGDHFYTRMVQRRALKLGSQLASKLNDPGASAWYQLQANEIERDLNSYWDASKGYLVATRNRVGGLDYKNSNLDAAVILALIHGSMDDGFMTFSDSRVLATLEKISQAFLKIYPINQRDSIKGLAIGRYPEDRYGGANFDGGNPWPLCSLAFAEAYYRAASELKTRGQNDKASELSTKGNDFVARVQYHAHQDGSLNEQIDRSSGYMTSVSDLTWNYAAILSTQHYYQKLIR